MLGDLIGDVLVEFLPEHPLFVYGAPAVVFGGGLLALADPFPTLAVGLGTLASGALALAYEYTGVSAAENQGSTADRIAVGAFVAAVVAFVAYSELVGLSAASFVWIAGAATGLFAGALVTEWVVPAIASRRRS
ncbi:hypothetical protein JCM30237_02710 [Halolamina litorea]